MGMSTSISPESRVLVVLDINISGVAGLGGVAGAAGVGAGVEQATIPAAKPTIINTLSKQNNNFLFILISFLFN